ncbi:MAG: response regulator [Anaerolineae bacterium]|nr:response regulator [Anaerolineae bacterium]
MIRVLYVEDEPAQRELVNQLLQLAGLEIQMAPNGLVGLELAVSWQPDVILMDLRLPQMDGFETIERLKISPQTMHIPVVILSALTGAKRYEHAKSLGIYAYIDKPFSFEDLVNTIRNAAQDGVAQIGPVY